MAKEPVLEQRAAPQKNDSCLLIKLFISVLLTSSHFPSASSLSTEKEEKPVANKNGISQQEKCDIFSGEWIPDPTEPSYNNNTCNSIDFHQNCLKNGRPDRTYLHWRWSPFGCELPRLDPKKFLNVMRHKSWAFVGDSIFRNHIESLLCLLSRVEEPSQIYADEFFESRTWYFPSYNLTMAHIWAPFLVESNAHSSFKGQLNVKVDVLPSKWTSEYHKHDYVIISGGQWFYKSAIYWEKNQFIGCHNCPLIQLQELGVGVPYQKALRTAFNFITSSSHKPLVFLRTWTPQHFENGEWWNGGKCNRTMPYREGEYTGLDVDLAMRAIEIEEFEKAAANGAQKGLRMELIDIYHMSLLRPDGHPGIYRTFHPESYKNKSEIQNDCLHWCLPGPIDTWNDMIMKLVMNHQSQSSATY